MAEDSESSGFEEWVWQYVKVVFLLSLCVASLSAVGVYGLGPVGDDRVVIEPVERSSVDESSLVLYEELPAEEQQMFRAQVPATGVTNPGVVGAWESAEYVELDGEYYVVEESNSVGGVAFTISDVLFVVSAVIGVISGLVGLLWLGVRAVGRVVAHFDITWSPPSWIGLAVFFIVVGGCVLLVAGALSVSAYDEFITETDMVVVSESPVVVDESGVAEADVLFIGDMPRDTSEFSFAGSRADVESKFKGGDAVAKSETEYVGVWSVSRDWGEQRSLDGEYAETAISDYEYIRSDGELYHVTIQEDTQPSQEEQTRGWATIGIIWLMVVMGFGTVARGVYRNERKLARERAE